MCSRRVEKSIAGIVVPHGTPWYPTVLQQRVVAEITIRAQYDSRHDFTWLVTTSRPEISMLPSCCKAVLTPGESANLLRLAFNSYFRACKLVESCGIQCSGKTVFLKQKSSSMFKCNVQWAHLCFTASWNTRCLTCFSLFSSKQVK